MIRRAAALLALLLASTTALAQADPRTEAKRYFEAGDQAYSAGRYELAARAYEEAYRRVPLPAIAFSLAQANRLAYYQDRDRKKLERALELYRRYLADAPDGNRRVHATQHIEAIEGILRATEPKASDAAEASPAGPASATLLMVASTTAGARARIDAGEMSEVPFARSVSPGRHRIRVEAPGYFPTDRNWMAVAGRLVVAPIDLAPRPAKLQVRAPAGASVHFDGRWAGEAPLSRPITAEAGAHVVTVARRGHRSIERAISLERGATVSFRVGRLEPTPQRIASHWVLGSSAVLLAGGATTTLLAVLAEDRVQSYDDRLGTERLTEGDRRSREDDLSARGDFRTASYVLFGGAAVAGATGALLFQLDEPFVTPRPRSGLEPVASPGILGARWTFTR